MAKIIVVLLATLFLCGVMVHYVPYTQTAAFGNSHEISWLLCIGCVVFVGSWRALGK